MTSSWACSFAASSARPPFVNASMESRRILICRFSTSRTASSLSLSGVFSISHAARSGSATPFLMRSSIAAWRRATSSLRTAARTKRSVSRRTSSRALTAATASRSSWDFSDPADWGEDGASALATLGFLALAACRRALVVLAPAGLSEDPGLLDLLVEPAEGSLERLTFADDHFGHVVCGVTPLSVIQDNAGAPRRAADSPNDTWSRERSPVNMCTALLPREWALWPQ